MPQVASDPAIRPVRPEPLGRPAAAGEPSGTFGEMLDASAGSAAKRPDGSARTGKTDGADQTKSGDQAAPAVADGEGAGSTPAKSAGLPATPADAEQSKITPVETPPVVIGTTAVMAVDLAILAQVTQAEPNGEPLPGLSNGKAESTDKVSPTADEAVSDKAADGSDDAAAVAAAPDAQTIAIPAVVVAVVVPSATPAAIQVTADNSDNAGGIAGIPSSAAPSSPPITIESTPAQERAQVAAAPASPAATETSAASAEPVPTTKTAAAVSADVSPAPAEATPASPVPAKAGDKTAGLLQMEAKSLPRAEQQPARPTIQGDKADARKVETAKAKDAPHAGVKPTRPQDAAGELHVAGQAAEADAKAPAAPQPHGQPSEHASATARVAFTAAQSDILSPTAVAQAVTAQVNGTSPALGIPLAAPASPLQNLGPVVAQRLDSNDHAVPIAGIAVEIVARAQDGLRRFDIRLDPPELGRIDVRLDVDKGGNVTSRLTVERAETLDLLRRDAPQLERALQHAGLNTEGGLQFSLRDQNFANREQTPHHAATLIVPDDEPAAAEAARRGYGRLIGLGGGIDIRV